MQKRQTLPEGKLEPALLEELLTELPTDATITIKPGLGFDSAGIEVEGDYISAATDPITFAAQNIGLYSVAVNINDIVCQGCRPRWSTASLMLPPGTPEQELKSLWRDLAQALKKWDVAAAGGHTEVTDAVNRPLLCGQMIGEPVGENLLDPREAKSGAYIYQWRPAALEGLSLLARENEDKLAKYISRNNIKKMKSLLQDPGICVWPEAEKMLRMEELTALHDPTEGGIATAIHELADAAERGVEIREDSLLWPPGGKELARKLEIDPLGLLSSGCLLVVTSDKLSDPGDYSLTQIGRFTEDQEKILVDSQGSAVPLPRYNQDQLLLV